MIETFESLIFLRGMSLKYPIDKPSVVSVRQDRKPKDTDADMHYAADAWFLDRFGINYRSNAVFVTSKKISAASYAGDSDHIFRFLPLEDYNYCWSPKCSDMWSLTNGCATPKDLLEKLEGSDYLSSNLKLAHEMGHEVMVFCRNYVAIPISLINNPAPSSTENKIWIGP